MRGLIQVLAATLMALGVYARDQHVVDSRTNALKQHKQDTTAAKILSALPEACWGNDPGIAMDYASRCFAFSEEIGFKKGMAAPSYGMGAIHAKNKGEIEMYFVESAS